MPSCSSSPRLSANSRPNAAVGGVACQFMRRVRASARRAVGIGRCHDSRIAQSSCQNGLSSANTAGFSNRLYAPSTICLIRSRDRPCRWPNSLRGLGLSAPGARRPSVSAALRPLLMVRSTKHLTIAEKDRKRPASPSRTYDGNSKSSNSRLMRVKLISPKRRWASSSSRRTPIRSSTVRIFSVFIGPVAREGRSNSSTPISRICAALSAVGSAKGELRAF